MKLILVFIQTFFIAFLVISSATSFAFDDDNKPDDFGFTSALLGGGFGGPGFGGGGAFGGRLGIGGAGGAGFAGPGFAAGGVIKPNIVCTVPGPCYQKRLTCPDDCFHTFTTAGNGYGGGGSSGGCNYDCQTNCVASC